MSKKDDDHSDGSLPAAELGGALFSAIEMTGMPMILTDPRQPDNPIVFANNAFLELTGYTEDEVLGRNCRFLQGADTELGQVEQLREAVAAHRPVALELLNYRRDGTPFRNAVFIGPVFDKAGEVLFYFASQLNVSRRQALELPTPAALADPAVAAEAYGQAALRLVESLMHELRARLVLSHVQTMRVIDIAYDTQSTIAEDETSPGPARLATGLIGVIQGTFMADRKPPGR